MAAPATPSYDPAATVKKLEELDKLLPDVKASEQQEKFQKVQVGVLRASPRSRPWNLPPI